MKNTTKDGNLAYFGLGCFWAPDEFFSKLPGIVKTRVGYTGGTTKNPTYDNLGDHTETVEITFDPVTISYQTLLHHFWNQHDPTISQIPQYRSAIFTLNDEQQNLAEKSKDELQKKTRQKIVTDITHLSQFFEAEAYHQHYYQKK